MTSKLPYNYIENIPYSKKRKLLYHLVFKLADILGFWRYPSDLDPDHWRKLVNDIYWCYKSAKPIIKPEKGSELQAYFAEKRRQIDRPLLPEGFQCETSAKISAVGDLIRAKGIENSGGKFYKKVADLIFDADISIANLESPPTSAKIAKPERTIQSTR